MANMEIGRVSKIMEHHDDMVRRSSQPFGLKDLAYEVEQAIPGCRVTPENNLWSWVYMPDDHYAMGMIGYGDFRDKGDGTDMYTVKARTIQNGKYNDYSRQYHMAMSTKREVAVKNAKKYLRRFSPLDVAETSVGALRYVINEQRNKAQKDLRATEIDLFGGVLPTKNLPMAVEELRILAANHHPFVDPNFGDALRNYFAQRDEVYADAGQAHNMTFVSITKHGDKVRWDVADVDGAERYIPNIHTSHTYFDGVPEELMGKVSVLNMLEDETYIAGVGFKLFDGVYYVDR